MLERESGHSGAPPSCIFFYPSSPSLEWESGHSGAPPLALPSISCFFLVPTWAAWNPQVIQIQSDLPISLAPRRTPWKIQSYLPYPSLMQSVRALPGSSPLIFSRRSLDPLLSGFLSLFFILEAVHLVTDLPLAFLSLLFYWLCF